MKLPHTYTVRHERAAASPQSYVARISGAFIGSATDKRDAKAIALRHYRHTLNPQPLYTVVAISRKTGVEQPPSYDLRPMNHAAACNFMDACRNAVTDYRIHPWPEDIPFPGEPSLADSYRRDQDREESEKRPIAR